LASSPVAIPSRIGGAIVCQIEDGGHGMWVKWLRMALGRARRIGSAAQ
jgi:hypothetical protein